VLCRRLVATEPSRQIHQNIDPTIFIQSVINQLAGLDLIGQRPRHSEHADACVSQLFGPGFNVALLARTNGQLSAAVSQRPGDGLPKLSVAAHAGYDGHFAFKTDLHVSQSSAYLDIAQRIDFSSTRLAISVSIRQERCAPMKKGR
jgi:hypothetical protein